MLPSKNSHYFSPKMTQTVAPIKLIGPELIAHTENSLRAGESRTDLIIKAGYFRIKDDATMAACYVEFYENLLEAKREANPELYAPECSEPVESYDDLSEESQALYDHLSEEIGQKWKHEEQLEFLELMASELGIETRQQFEDAFYTYIDSQWNAEAEFAEELTNELENISSNSIFYSAIDWQKVWDHNLRYDFNIIEFDGCTYFFRNI